MHGNTGIRGLWCEASSVVRLRFQSGTDQHGQILELEPDLRHAPLIIKESGRNANTKTMSSPREKLQDKFVLDGRKSPVLKKKDATRDRSACMRPLRLVQGRSDLAKTAKLLAQRMSETREIVFCSTEACSTESCRGNQKLQYDSVDKNTLTKSKSPWTAISLAIQSRERERATRLVARIGVHTVKSESTHQSLIALSAGGAAFHAVVKGCQIGLSLRSIHMDVILWPIGWEQDQERNT